MSLKTGQVILRRYCAIFLLCNILKTGCITTKVQESVRVAKKKISEVTVRTLLQDKSKMLQQ